MNLTEQILNFIQKNGLISSGDRVLAAVSGGVDSMVMMEVLYRLKDEIEFELGAAHFNHKLRGEESERDARFVEAVASALKIDCHFSAWERKDEEVQGSTQTAAREARFTFFEGVMQENRYNVVALGHHLDDHIETVMMAVLKGYGINGLSGIPVKNGNRIHPLLSVRKDEILRYAGEAGIEFVNDSSNYKTEYLRNRVRLDLLPEIEAIFPDYRNGLRVLSEDAKELKEYLCRQEESLYNNGTIWGEKGSIILDINDFLPYFNMLKRFIISQIIRTFNPDSRVSRGIIGSIIKLLDSESGAVVEYDGIEIFRERNTLVFQRDVQSDEIIIDGYGTYIYGNYILELKPCNVDEVELVNDKFVEFIDSECIKGRLRLRSWREGDFFYPLGMTGMMKLSDFFVNNKVGISEKPRIPILVDDEKTVWICGYRLDSRVRITDAAKHPVKLILKDRDLHNSI